MLLIQNGVISMLSRGRITINLFHWDSLLTYNNIAASLWWYYPVFLWLHWLVFITFSELWHIFDSWNCNKCDNCHRVWCHECVTNVRCHVTSSWHTWWHSFLSHSEMFTSWKSIINFYCQCLTPNRWKSVDCKNEMCWKRLWKLIRQNQQTRIQASLFSRRGHVWWKINTGGKYLIQQDTKIFKGGC